MLLRGLPRADRFRPMTDLAAAASPLTILSEDERLFQSTVRDFAEQEVRPRVAAMEKASAIDPTLIPKLFALGLMGIEIPEPLGGAGGTLFLTTLAVEELSAVDASLAILVDVQNTLVNVPLLSWATVEQKRRYLPQLASEVVGAYALTVLGEVGKGYKIAIERLNTGRIGIGAQMIGVARGALDAAVKYVKERKQFGKPVAEFQAVQFQLAQGATELEAARLMVYNAARLRDAGQEYTQHAAMAKLFSSQVAERVTSLCVELFGGYGYTKEYPVEKFYRDAKIGTIYEGTSNMQLNTIAKLLLK